jgi:hypothetical protein
MSRVKIKKNRPAEKDEQKRQILQQEAKSGEQMSNTEGTADSTANLGEQGGDADDADADAGARAPREGRNSRTRAGGLGEDAPASDEPSEEDTATANAPNKGKMKANRATHKENAVKASSKPKNEAADAPGNRAKVAASDAAEAEDDVEDEDDRSPLDEQPAHTIHEGYGTAKVRIKRQVRKLVIAGVDVLEELRRTSLNVGDEVTVAENVAHNLIDKGNAVLLDGDEEVSRTDVMRGNREDSVEDEEEVARPVSGNDRDDEEDEDSEDDSE